jgi:hypothetical protein
VQCAGARCAGARCAWAECSAQVHGAQVHGAHGQSAVRGCTVRMGRVQCAGARCAWAECSARVHGARVRMGRVQCAGARCAWAECAGAWRPGDVGSSEPAEHRAVGYEHAARKPDERHGDHGDHLVIRRSVVLAHTVIMTGANRRARFVCDNQPRTLAHTRRRGFLHGV